MFNFNDSVEILGKLSPEEVNRLIPNPQAFAA